MRIGVALVTMVLAAAAPAAARAQAQAHDQEAAELMTDAARSKAEEGLARYQQRHFAEAYESFRLAEELFHAPTLVWHMGNCQREMGHLLAAREAYRRVVAERLAAEPPEAYKAAQRNAGEALLDVERRIPRVRIVVSGASAAVLRVTLDGKPAPIDPTRIDVDPGEHRIEAKAPGAEAAEQRFVAAEGDDKPVAIALVPLRAKTVVITKPSGPAVGLAPGLALLGVGVAALAAGIGTGVVALRASADLQDQCGGFVCPRTLQDQRDGATPFATAATVTFAVAGAALVAGSVLLPLHFTTRPKQPALTASIGPQGGALTWRW